jgi:hypothetical protein
MDSQAKSRGSNPNLVLQSRLKLMNLMRWIINNYAKEDQGRISGILARSKAA